MITLLLLLQFQHSSKDPGGLWIMSGQFECLENDARLGFDAALLGDVNGDGKSDYVLGAYEQSNGSVAKAGAVYLMDGNSSTPLFEYRGTIRLEKLGYDVCLIHDLNQDGIPEFGAVSPNMDVGQVAARVFDGATGSVLHQLLVPPGTRAYGNAIEGVGDWDMDGIPDFAVADDWYDVGSSLVAGAIFVYSGVDATLLQRIDGAGSGHHLGQSIRSAGDLNGDRRDDLLSWTHWVTGGSVDVIEGGTGSLLYRLTSLTGGGYFGDGIDFVDDLDGDGCDEIIVGATQSGPNERGDAYLFSGLTGTLIFSWPGELDYRTSYGEDVACIGDVNHDGFADVAIGMPSSIQPLLEGRVYVYSGRDGHMLHKITSGPDSKFGAILDGGRDVNGDNRPDMLVTDDIATVNGTRGNGAAYVFSFRPFLESSAHGLSAAAGGTIDFGVNFPLSEAGLSYRLLASTDQLGDPSGVGKPWMKVHGVSIPLVETALTYRMWNNPPAIFSGAQGRLNADGNAFIRLRLAPGAAAGEVGRTLRFAAVTITNAGQASASSAAVLLTIEP